MNCLKIGGCIKKNRTFAEILLMTGFKNRYFTGFWNKMCYVFVKEIK